MILLVGTGGRNRYEGYALSTFFLKRVQRIVKISEITMIYKNYHKKEKEIKFQSICWPLKLCLHNFAEQSLHCSIILQGKEQSLQEFTGQRTKAL